MIKTEAAGFLKSLKEPFPSNRISWRIGRAGKTGDKIWVKALAYFDARDGMDRLDEVVGPENWQDEYRKDGAAVIARIGILVNGIWVWKEGTSEETDIEAVKGGESGAFKRACVKWGIGRYLYDLSEMFANTCAQNVEGAIYAKTNDLGTFYWQAPILPDWARPASEGRPQPGLVTAGIAGTYANQTLAAQPPASISLAPPMDADRNPTGAYSLNFGKYKGQRLDSIGAHDLDNYLQWLRRNKKPGEADSPAMVAIDSYLKTREVNAKQQ